MTKLDAEYVLRALSDLRSSHAHAFGSQAHDFRLNPTLGEDEVIAFETAHSVLLPPDYREFLTRIGNGGAGPFYGIFPLGFADHMFDSQRWQENDGLVGCLSQPFPFDEQWNDLADRPMNNGGQSAKQWEMFEETYWNFKYLNGTIPICRMGCALRVYLVVSGPQAGYLWEDRRAECEGIKPLKLRNGSKATFGGWYCEWLEESVRHSQRIQRPLD